MSQTGRTATTSQTTKLRNQRLTLTEKDPQLAVRKGWLQEPAFCRGYFDRCEDRALTGLHDGLDKVLAMGHHAVRFAHVNGDHHLINESEGVLAHVHIARSDLFWAGRTLRNYRRRALACCARCRSDYFRRLGDFLGESRWIDESLAALRYSLEVGGEDLSPDTRARIAFLRGISHHHAGQREQALKDVDHVLRHLSLDSPRGFFLDTISCAAIFIRGGSARQDAMMLEALERFRQRIKGLDGWQQVRMRLCWVEGHLNARLERIRPALDRLETAWRRLLTHGMAKEAVAVVTDVAQLRCRHPEPRADNLRTAKRLITQCLAERSDLQPEHRKGLGEMNRILEHHPEDAFRLLGEFRDSFTTVVPSRLAERMRRR